MMYSGRLSITPTKSRPTTPSRTSLLFNVGSGSNNGTPTSTPNNSSSYSNGYSNSNIQVQQKSPGPRAAAAAAARERLGRSASRGSATHSSAASPAPSGSAATTEIMSAEDVDRLSSLMKWLQTFDQYDFDSGTMTPEELLSQASVATIVLRITEEILDREVATPSSRTVESIWAQIFATLQSPKLLQKMAGRRLGSTELRYVLLSALLSTSVHPTCEARIKYINRIMTLEKPVQHSLMTLIESFPKTPNKSPGRAGQSPGRNSKSPARNTNNSTSVGRSPGGRRSSARLTRTPRRSISNAENDTSVAETPRSSGSRRLFASRSSSSHGSSSQKLFPDEPDLLALMGWIRTFPQLHGLGSLSQLSVLTDVKVSLAILHVAEHVCGHQPSPPAFTSATDTWAAMENVISMSTPGVSLMGRNLKNMTMEEHQLALLSALICFSVSDSSIDRKTHVGMILSLPRDMQQRLRKIIEAPMGSSERTVSSITESNVSRRSREEETPTGFTPAKKKQNAAADDALFSPAIGMDRMVQDLKEQNHQLQKQLANSTSREAELAIRMQDLEQKVRRDMMRIESNHLRKADEAHEAHTKELTELRDELFALQTVRAKEEVAQRELSTIKDEMDLMEHTKEKLTETEEKLRKCKERLEQLADVKESLKREEEAHSASVEECLRLDNELKSLQPLRRQLDEYKARTIDAEFKLVECQDALQQMSAMSANLNSTHSELVKGARLQQEEADGLRMKLSKDDDDEDIDEGLGEGISELNPHVKEELLRLRYENKELHEFRAKREADGVTRLEEQLDDVQRLCDRFKEQYLSTKKELEVTVVDLKETKEHEEQLKRDVAEWTGKWESMDAWATELQGQLDTTRQELTETIQLLEESKEREEGLTTNVEGLTKEKEELIVESEERLAELTSTQQEATDTMELLVQSQDREKELHTDLEDVEEKLQAEQQRCGGFENELNLAVEELDTTKHDLNETIDREKKVRSNLVELSEEKDALDQELEAEKEAREADRIEAVMKVAEAREGLEAESKQALEDLEANMNMLLEGERESSKKKLQQGNDDYQQLFEQNASDYNDLQTKMTSSLEETIRDYDVRITRLKEDYTSQMEAVKVEADASRDKLVSRGKNMLKDTKDKAEEIIRELEDELEDTKESLSTFRKDKDEFEHKIRAKVTSYKHKLQFSSSRINELSEENDQLMDTVHTVEKEKAKVLEENERYRRQLGGRYGADGKNQNQMDMLQKEFNAILEENRNLKRKLASAGSTGMLGAISEGEPEYGDTSSGKPYARGGVSGSTLSALREEYEEQIQSLNDEKRELVMRNSAAITDVQKAEQRAWELEKNMERLKEDLTSSHLALQRAELNMDDDQTETGAVIDQSFVSREESFHSAKETEEERRQYMDTILSNQGPSEDALDHETQSPLLVDLDIFPMQPETPTNVLSPSNHQIESAKKKVSFGGATSKPLSRSSSESSEGPSLMELTMQNGGSQDGQPECKQS